ncbi:Chromosome transmission fidelity protein 18 [Marasmius crinis-equi]|uniref:Chromosome transmission fidelity protein 18 n=1 Tax=Marasmius crinis-equi TaxID=585013 RepID=A0ABR3FHE9_9AGAR
MSTATATSSFMPNGLLGSSSPLESDSFLPNGLLSGETEQEDDVGMFKPTGLLGSGSSEEAGFEPNGLLGEGFTPNGLLSGPKSMMEDAGTGEDSFVPTGLLGESGLDGESSTDSFVPTGLLSNSQEPSSQLSIDELPPLLEAFKPTTSRDPSHTVPSFTSLTSTTSKYTVKATTYDGKNIFLKKKILEAAAISERKIANLLDVPMHRLMEQLSEATVASLTDGRPQPSTSKTTSASSVIETTLWVDRYRPKKFTDLMGNERVARDTLAWVKQWDWCVFGKSNKGKKRSREGEADENDQDEYRRPQEKILLLSGPPGLGKTTLAHVVARQAGYEVMEINASDARSGQIVDDRIRPALEAGHGVRSSKPLLLVIDEIDGATGAGDNSGSFVHKLVQLTQDRPRKKTRSGRKDPNAKRPILRPIICICNDINASSLAKLRPHAFQVRYQRPADVHTVKRLREICVSEGLKADSRALSTLVGIAQGDLRGCLNTLQFIKSKHKEVTEGIIRTSTRGMKESETSISSVMNSLFAPISKKRVKELGLNDEAESRNRWVLPPPAIVQPNNSPSTLGCFAHYCNLRRHDANLSRHEKAAEWLLTFDRMSAAMYSDGDFALLQYIPYTLVGFHPLFQERGAPRVERDMTDWENLQTTRTNEEIYKSLGRCLQTAGTRHAGDFRHLGNKPILQMEFAPMLNRIINPPLRPLNNQIIRPEERTILSRLVDIMSTLELRFVQERTEDGQLTYRLDPPVDVFVTYDGKRAADMAVPRYAVRHLVAGEIDTRVNTQQEIVEKGSSGKSNFFGAGSSPSKSGETPGDGRPAKRARVEATDIADRPPTDFFGRLITPSAAPKSNNNNKRGTAVKEVIKQFRISYKYKEATFGGRYLDILADFSYKDAPVHASTPAFEPQYSSSQASSLSGALSQSKMLFSRALTVGFVVASAMMASAAPAEATDAANSCASVGGQVHLCNELRPATDVLSLPLSGLLPSLPLMGPLGGVLSILPLGEILGLLGFEIQNIVHGLVGIGCGPLYTSTSTDVNATVCCTQSPFDGIALGCVPLAGVGVGAGL